MSSAYLQNGTKTNGYLDSSKQGYGNAQNGYAENNGFDQFINDQFEDDAKMNGQQEGDVEYQYKKQQTILDGLTEHRAERAHILLKNLPNEDLVHVDDKKVPAFLRIDKDVKARRAQLQEFHEAYQRFNIAELEKGVQSTLQQKISVESQEYAEHSNEVAQLLAQGEETNQNSQALQDSTVQMRVVQNKNITDAMKDSNRNMKQFEVLNQQKQELRDRLYSMQIKLRKMQVTIEEEQIKNDNLKNVKNFELGLRKTRDAQETEMLNTAGITQKSSMKWTQDSLTEVLKQDDLIKQENQDLKAKMSQRQKVNVQQLIKLIDNDMQVNQNQIGELNAQIKDVDNEYLSYKHNNKQMGTQVQKLEQTFREIRDQERETQAQVTENMKELEVKIQVQNEKAKANIKNLAETQKQLQKLKNSSDTLQSKIDISQSIQAFHDSCNYKKKIAELKKDLDKSKMKSDVLETTLTEQQEKWNVLYEKNQNDLRKSIEDTNSDRCLQQIHNLVEQIKSKEDQIQDLNSEIQEIMREQQSPIDDKELNLLKVTVQTKVTEYKVLLNDKQAFFEEMYLNASLLINRDLQIVENQGQIVSLKHDIDINLLEIEQKSVIIDELQQILEDKIKAYKTLKREIKELDEQCEELLQILKQKEGELETLEDVLRDKDVIIEGLEKTLGEKAPVLTDADRTKKMSNLYKAVQGDIVDELLGKYINSMEISVPIRRLGDGFYLFGTRRIFAKVLNNKLVVRVGGGFMSFTEFIDTYALAELKKINELQATGDWDLEKFIQGQMEQESPAKRKSAMGGRASVSPMRIEGRKSPGGYAAPIGQGRRSPNYGK